MAIKVRKRNPMAKIYIRRALNSIAKDVVNASERGVGAGDDVLYRLPGVFSMSIHYHDRSVRLIKEANVLRIMEKFEKSEELLLVSVLDLAALTDLKEHKATWQKLYAEGRLVFAGKVEYAAAIIRVVAAGDKACLPRKKYRNLYGE